MTKKKGDAELLFVHIGKGNVINAAEVLLVIPPNRTAARRYLASAKDKTKVIDATGGKRFRSLIVMKTGDIIKATISYETLMGRLNGIPKPNAADVLPEEEDEYDEEEEDLDED